MKIEFEDRVWQLALDEVTVKQGEKIAAYTGLPLLPWYASLTKTDEPGWLKSMQCFYWLMREQNESPVPLEEADFAPLKLMGAFNDAAANDSAGADAEPDPTKPAGEPGAEEPSLPAESPSG